MSRSHLSAGPVRRLLAEARRTRVIVVGDVMLDHFIWGTVDRISPEAPVPVVAVERESFMPGGAGNVARNLTTMQVPTELCGVVGRDPAGRQLKRLLGEHGIEAGGVLAQPGWTTGVKTRIVAHKQQVVRVDRERQRAPAAGLTARLAAWLRRRIGRASAVIVADYAKGVITQPLLDEIKALCHRRGIWLSLDPKPVHQLDLSGLSLITPNRKETFELARLPDETPDANPLADSGLLRAAQRVLEQLQPAMLLVTLGELGMLLCQRGRKPFHIPTVSQEVFDVSGAGDTVIAIFTLAIAAGASPLEAALLSNHAAGIVVGKFGTATVAPEELAASLRR
jgi:D-beta-D-heptose 7-phosphate kinase/D-beta-D-heptose 1-phosphate adenosyltransferase